MNCFLEYFFLILILICNHYFKSYELLILNLNFMKYRFLNVNDVHQKKKKVEKNLFNNFAFLLYLKSVPMIVQSYTQNKLHMKYSIIKSNKSKNWFFLDNKKRCAVCILNVWVYYHEILKRVMKLDRILPDAKVWKYCVRFQNIHYLIFVILINELYFFILELSSFVRINNFH